jgi:hypothetical protein
VRHILRFEVGAETLATFREAMKELQKRCDHRLEDDAALLLMARQILGGPGDAGRASYQVVVTQCEDCGRGFQHANGELIELDPAIVEMCRCDAQNVPVAHLQGVTSDAPDGPTANPSKLAQARARAVTGQLAHAHAGTSAHAGVIDELAPEDVTDQLAHAHHAHAHSGNADELALAARAMHCTGDLAHADAQVKCKAREVAHAEARVGRGVGESPTPTPMWDAESERSRTPTRAWVAKRVCLQLG